MHEILVKNGKKARKIGYEFSIDNQPTNDFSEDSEAKKRKNVKLHSYPFSFKI